MKTTILKQLIILIALTLSVAGCKKNEHIYGVSLSELVKAPKHLVSKDELPNFLKDNYNLELSYIIIYKGEWNKRIVYYVPNFISSCSYCEYYYEDGKHIFDGHDDPTDFYTTSKNWIIIYIAFQNK